MSIVTTLELIELQELITEREAMIAENKAREIRGQPIGYDYDHFMQIASQIRELANNIKKRGVN